MHVAATPKICKWLWKLVLEVLMIPTMYFRFYLLFCTAIALIIVADDAEAKQKIPVGDFIEQPFLNNPRLSPNGQRLVMMAKVKGEDRIAILDLSKPEGKNLQTLEAKIGTLNWVKWFDDNTLLIGLRTSQYILGIPFPVDQLMVGRLDTMSFKLVNKESTSFDNDRVLFEDYANRRLLMTSYRGVLKHPDIVSIDLSTGTETIVQKRRKGIDQWFVDESGNVRGGVAYARNRWKIYYRDTPENKLELLTKQRARDLEGVIETIKFSPKTGQTFVISNSPKGRFGVYQYDFETNDFGATIYEHPSADVLDFVLDGEGKVVGVSFEDEKFQKHWLDEDIKKLQSTIDRIFKGRVNNVIDVSKDKKTILFSSSTASDPGSFYLYYPDKKKVEQVLRPFTKIDPVRLAEVKPVSYTARDGLIISGYLTMPKGKQETQLPAVILPHGGPFLRTSWTYDPWVQFLANRGYAVLQPNFRGSTGYGNAFVERGYGQWGAGMVDDIEDGVDWMITEGYADPNRICIMGASYGGYAAIWSSMRSPERYQCSISWAGVTDVKAMLKHDKKLFAARRYHREWEAKVAGQEEADLSAISPVQQAARLKVPLFLAHGKKDSNVPFKQAQALEKALDHVGYGDLETSFYEKSGHNPNMDEDFQDFLERVEVFLNKHNPVELD